MSSQEIALASRRFRERITAILTADELACYEAYERRVLEETTATEAVRPTPKEQTILHITGADSEAVALQRQLRALLDVIKLPQ